MIKIDDSVNKHVLPIMLKYFNGLDEFIAANWTDSEYGGKDEFMTAVTSHSPEMEEIGSKLIDKSLTTLEFIQSVDKDFLKELGKIAEISALLLKEFDEVETVAKSDLAYVKQIFDKQKN